MTVHLVSTIDQVLALALVPLSTDKRDKKAETKGDVKSGRSYPPPPA